MRFLFTICLLLSSIPVLRSQASSDPIGSGSFNQKYLEHLVKIKVDSVRRLHNCKDLVNDSILYVASAHHARYMLEKSKLTHFEEESKTTRTPQQRAEHYGAKNYSVGENVLMTPYNTNVSGKHGELFDTRSYGGLADNIVSGWVNSPGHFKNIITPEYQVTGVTVAYDPATKKLYACQKFAQVAYKYAFEESRDFFSYSDYKPEKPVMDFSASDRQLLDHKHEWKVEHKHPEKCTQCLQMQDEKPFITLRVERNSFILKIENSEYVQKLIRDRRDGFAVEIVSFDDYMCGNPAYYTKPSRRNGQCMLNGRILEPLYRADLEKGYRKRKRQKDVNFISYIAKSDSIPFFKRFSSYRTARFTSEYFEISLGKVPKDITGMWAHNLVYLQEKEICHVDYFTNYCGAVFYDTVVASVIAPAGIPAFSFKPESGKLGFEIPFERNKSAFVQEDIRPFTESLSKVSYTIDSIFIKAYSSVEGDSAVNAKLQLQRANSIAELLKSRQKASIPVSIQTTADWEHFYASVRKSPSLKFLAAKSRNEINAYLSQNRSAELESILQKERKADIRLYYTIPVNAENLKHNISTEYKRLSDSIAQKPLNAKAGFLQAISGLYGFTYAKVRTGALAPDFLAALKMPVGYAASTDLVQQFVLYGYVYPEAYNKNLEWKNAKDQLRKRLSEDKTAQLLPEFLYNECRIKAEQLIAKKTGDAKQIQSLIEQIEALRDFYFSSPEAAANIEKLALGLNMLLLNHTFFKEPMAKSDDAGKAVEQLLSYYETFAKMDASRALQLAKTSVYYNNVETALEILAPYMADDSVLVYAIPLAFQHPSEPFSAPWFDYLIQLHQTTAPEVWCNFFINDCQVPFQVFDHEKLRNLFCTDCMQKNDFLKQLNP